MATKKKTTRTKKKLSTGGKIIIGVAVIGAGWATWEYLLKGMFMKPGSDTPPAPDNTPQLPAGGQINQVVNALDQVQPNVESLDDNKKLSKGSKGVEVERVQTNFNDIIDKMRKTYALPYHSVGMFTNIFGSGNITTERIKKIADLSQLTVDGNFGSKTENAGAVIMGKKTFSLKEVRTKKDQLFNAIGL